MAPVRIRRPVRVLALALLASLLSLPAFAEPVAIIAALKGRVEVTPAAGGAAQKAAFGRPLERGDRVAVGAAGAATLFFHDGNVIELAEKSTLTVGARPAGKAGGGATGLPGEVYASVTKFVAGGSRETGLVALAELRSAPAGQDTPFLVAPRRTALIETRPAFSWRAVAQATRYRVSLSSAERGELWSREVEGLSLPYPADAEPLARGSEYLWEVEALTDIKSLRRESSVFHLLPEGQSDAVRANLERIRATAGGSESAAARFLAGSYLTGIGLYLDAAEHFGALCRLSPSSPAPHEALGDLYTKVGLMDLAAAEYQQALALTREP